MDRRIGPLMTQNSGKDFLETAMNVSSGNGDHNQVWMRFRAIELD